MRRRTGEIQQGGPAVVRRHEANPDLRMFDEHVDAAIAAMEAARDVRQADEIVDRDSGVFARRDDLDVADRILATPERPDRPRPRDAAGGAKAVEEWRRDSNRAPERNARKRLAQRRQRETDLHLDVGRQPRHFPDGTFLHRDGEIAR